ncbi:MAG TPA: MGMT family protein [Aggregatilineales bacterium]|nr:MGMT family protein [Aggregatilineales bacterium]
MNFPEQVIVLTKAIPPGMVLNYGQIAQLLEKPRAARAVGYALQNLPFGTDVPWHRVVGKNGVYGKLSIRAFKYGRDEQLKRLQDEGIEFDEHEQFPLLKYLWEPDPVEVAAILNGASKS